MNVIDSAKEKIQKCKNHVEEFKTNHPTITKAVKWTIGVAWAMVPIVLSKYETETHKQEYYNDGYDDGHSAGFKEGEHFATDELLCPTGKYYPEGKEVHDVLNGYRLNNGREGDYTEITWAQRPETRIKLNTIMGDIHNKIDKE